MEKDKEYLAIANYVKKYSTCKSRNVGAVIVKDDKILSIGFNGAPDNYNACTSCYRRDQGFKSGTNLDKCYAVHAEQRALLDALRNGHDLSGATIYVNCSPCTTCAKLLIHLGINNIITSSYYPDEFSIDLMKNGKVNLKVIEEDLPELNDELKLFLDNYYEEKGIVKILN